MNREDAISERILKMKKISLCFIVLTLLCAGFTTFRPSRSGVDPNSIQVVGTVDSSLSYGQVMAGYLGLPNELKDIFKLQIRTLEDETYIVYITGSGTKFHRYDCRYVNETSKPVTRSSVEKNGYTPCKVCNP